MHMTSDYYLMDVKLNKEPNNGGYSLCLTYKGEDEHGNIHEKVLSGVPLPLYSNTRYFEYREEIGCYNPDRYFLDIGYGMLSVPKNFKTVDRIVEYACKEMTLEEIEKKLGHKVKIVAEKEE